eukprot:m.226983 g.226983  ORF g.226983 m.226983 type:complete len:82 (+) comp26407_c0_seq5:2169-2414(+)
MPNPLAKRNLRAHNITNIRAILQNFCISYTLAQLYSSCEICLRMVAHSSSVLAKRATPLAVALCMEDVEISDKSFSFNEAW